MFYGHLETPLDPVKCIKYKAEIVQTDWVVFNHTDITVVQLVSG